jgi:hypothetical protein
MAVLKRYNDATSEWEPVVVGKQGPSGVIDVTAPITNSGTETSAVIGIDESAIEITTSQISDLTATASALNTIDDGTLGFTALSNGTAGVTYQPVSPNYIINGAFDIWQRGTSFTNLSTTAFTADRWTMGRTSAHAGIDVTRSTDAPQGFEYSIKIQRQAGNTLTGNIWFSQRFEGLGKQLAGQEITISFWAKLGADASFTLVQPRFRSTSADAAATTYSANNGTMNSGNPDYATIPQNITADLTTSWQRFSFSGTVDALANMTQITIESLPSGTAGADDSIYYAGWQLEAGSVATPFRRNANSIQGELAACQRYYRRIQPGSGREMANGTMITTSIGRFYVAHAPTMRAGASITSGGTFDVLSGATLTPTGAISGVSAGFVGATFQVGVTPTTTTGFSALLRSQSADGFVAFDAEL